MLKFAEFAKVGDIIKAYDFKPMADRPDFFMSGRVIAKGPIKHPEHGFTLFHGYTIEVLGTDEGSTERKGDIGYVPFEVDFMEYDERVSIVATAEEVEMLIAHETEEAFH